MYFLLCHLILLDVIPCQALHLTESILMQVTELLFATQELSEMRYPADTVDVALVYANTEKANV